MRPISVSLLMERVLSNQPDSLLLKVAFLVLGSQKTNKQLMKSTTGKRGEKLFSAIRYCYIHNSIFHNSLPRSLKK